jgi:hypothetical protein
VLSVYGPVFAGWAVAEVPLAPLAWTAERCRSAWGRGVPLLAEAPPACDARVVAGVEEVLGPALAALGAARPAAAERFAAAWDRGDLSLAALYPSRGRIGGIDEAPGIEDAVLAFLATAALRPVLARHFAACRGYLADGDWSLGVCPFCGGPPGFGDVIEDGRRRLACHLCGGAWIFPRVRCPFCGNEEASSLARLEPDEAGEQGYSMAACGRCDAYLKELDRRVRWNGGPALVEDWGSPHFDLAARRQGRWRPAPPVILAEPATLA